MKTITVLAAFVVLLFAAAPGWSQTSDDKAKEHAELEKALKDAKVPLERALSASTREGTPISGKYEVEDGKLQLSVYTMKGNDFDHEHTPGAT